MNAHVGEFVVQAERFMRLVESARAIRRANTDPSLRRIGGEALAGVRAAQEEFSSLLTGYAEEKGLPPRQVLRHIQDCLDPRRVTKLEGLL